MGSILMKAFIFSISSFLTVALLYYQIKVIILQQIILFLIVIFILILRFLGPSIGKKAVVNWLLIFIITLFIQVLIAATGAVFSPFFVLIHLYVIGLSIFFDFWSAFAFLMLEIGVLLLNITFDQKLFYLVRGDFGSVLLYFSSIVVITPISKFISQQYHIKADTLKSLFTKLSAQESIIEEITDLVFTTDKNLAVLSANDSAKKVLNFEEKLSFTDLVELVDEKGKRLTRETLLSSLAPLISGKQLPYGGKLNLIIKGYTLNIGGRQTSTSDKKSAKVIVRVNSILSQTGSLEKFMFLVSQTAEKEQLSSTRNKLKETHQKYLSLHNLLRKDPLISKLTVINFYLEILKKYEADILISSQFDQTPPPLEIKVADIFRIFVKVFEQRQGSVQNFNVEYNLVLPDNLKEEYRLSIAHNIVPEYLTETSSVSATTDSGLLQILLEKTLDIVTQVAFSAKDSLPNNNNPQVELGIFPSGDTIKLTVATKLPLQLKETIQALLEVSKDKLDILDNLAFSSGLESYIIKNICNLLNISFTTDYNQTDSKLSFNILVNKYFKRQ